MNNYGGWGYTPPQTNVLQYQQITWVAGKKSIDQIKMAPNSSAILGDSTAPMVWMVMSDGVGTVTAEPYDIKKHVDPPSEKEIVMEQRLSNIETTLVQLQEVLNELRGVNNGQSNDASVESTATTSQSRKVVYANGAGVQ